MAKRSNGRWRCHCSALRPILFWGLQMQGATLVRRGPGLSAYGRNSLVQNVRPSLAFMAVLPISFKCRGGSRSQKTGANHETIPRPFPGPLLSRA